jgi:DNA-binding MarR family transcriptional regulator
MSKRSRDELLWDIGNLIRASQVSSDKFDDVASEVLGINRTDHRVLDVIDRLGPIAAGKLAKEAGLSPAAMTASLDRLEEAGIAHRVADPSDRRRVLVEVSPATRERAMKIYGPLEQTFLKQTERYSIKELELIRDFLERGQVLSEDHLERVKRMRPKQARRRG